MQKLSALALPMTIALGALLAPHAAQAQMVAKTDTVGGYTITLRVLPAESFTGAHAAMARDAGAQPMGLKASPAPNHHLVAFIRKDGKPVEDATVTISYRKAGTSGSWTELPVVRMHVAGKSLATTHYGNNVHLAAGSYEARVTVNGGQPAMYHFTVR
jgi:hypothetical protein